MIQLIDQLPDIIKNNKRTVYLCLGYIPAIVIALMVGRFSAPTKVVTQEKVVTQVQTKIQYQDRIVEKVVYKEAKATHKTTVTETTKKPDGTTTTKTTQQESTETDKESNKDKQEEKIVYKDRIVEKTVEKLKLVESKKADWRVGVGLGISVPVLLGHEIQGVPDLRGAVIQAEISRRIVGPFEIGLFGNTMGVAGVTLGGQF